MFIDTHCHLDDEQLVEKQNEIIKNLESNNIEKIINVGCDLLTSKNSVELSDNFKNVYAEVGIHPHEAKSRKFSDYDYFSKVSSNKKVVAIGEIGLDFYYDLSDRDVQKQVLVEQLELADSLNLPVVFHLRDAYNEFYQLLRDNKHYLKNGSVLHCYSGSPEMIKQFNQFDMFYSYGGAITFKNAKKRIEAVINTPIDKIMLETDSPYMAPVPVRGTKNTPLNVKIIAEKMSEILGKDLKEIEEITTCNAKKIFGRLK